MYYVYLIQSLSARGERYVRITTDLKRRFQEHNQGKSSHTTKFGPWKLITTSHSVIGPRQKLSSVISNPVQVMHSRESAYGNSVSQILHLLFSQLWAAVRSSFVRP